MNLRTLNIVLITLTMGIIMNMIPLKVNELLLSILMMAYYIHMQVNQKMALIRILMILRRKDTLTFTGLITIITFIITNERQGNYDISKCEDS
ncbi:hypothetical protein A6279_05640 [Bacillus wiedmannii]|nr:hypothetical protein A6278_08495 [Bacillus wiedmannii]OAK06896.1 hypothetical protein A6279_05640 [Bacillus wiedmannii]